MITRYILPKLWKSMSTRQILEQTRRVILYGSDVIRDDIPDLLDNFGVEYGLMDNEPDRESAFKFCDGLCLDIADQRTGLNQIYKKDVVMDGGRAFPVWLIRNEKFMSQVFDSFLLEWEDGYPLFRLPEEWSKWKNNPSSLSPLRHLMAPSKGANGWERGKDGVDDLFFALLFCEAAFYLQLEELGLS